MNNGERVTKTYVKVPVSALGIDPARQRAGGRRSHATTIPIKSK